MELRHFQVQERKGRKKRYREFGQDPSLAHQSLKLKFCFPASSARAFL